MNTANPETAMHKTLTLLTAALLALCPVAARAETWTTAGAAQFAAGELDAVSVRSTGEVVLAPAAEQIEGVECEFVWDIEASHEGDVYVGTGSPGGVFVLRKEGLEQLYESDKQHVLSVLPLLDGAVLAAVAPDGLILKIDRHGEVATFAELQETYVWDMAMGPTHAIYCATGPEGRLMQFDRTGEATELLKVEQKHLMCVATDADGGVYAGSAPDGYLYRVEHGGKSSLLYDAEEGEVHDVMVAPDGAVYICTAQAQSGPQPPSQPPEGNGPPAPPTPGPPIEGAPAAANSIYRVVPGEGASLVARLDQMFILALGLRDGRILAGTGPGGRLMAVEPDETQLVLSELEAAHITSLAVRPDGQVILGTANAGTLWRLGTEPAASGALVSKAFDAGFLSTWGRLWWRADQATGQQVRLKVRTGNSAEPDDHWSEWSSWAVDAEGEKPDLPLGRFAQFSAELSTHAGAGTPVLYEVNVSYRQTNRKPRIMDLLVDGESLLRPDGAEQQGQQGPPSRRRRPGSGNNGQDRLTKTIRWKVSDPNEDELAYDLYYRGEDEKQWKPLEEDIREETSYEWDISRVPGGRYLLKLVARDDLSRGPDQALRDERVTIPLPVDNRPPEVADLSAERREDGSYLIRGTARDELTPISQITVSHNADDWEEVFPADGIMDAIEEEFTYATEVLEPGEHVFVFAAADGNGNPGSGRIVVTVPEEE